jgi:DNA-binding IclR family transcriptional regulator
MKQVHLHISEDIFHIYEKGDCLAQVAVKSAIRALDILGVFEQHQRPMTLSEITRELGYPVSSGSALLKSLQESGYLDYDRMRKTYMPAMRVALLGRWVEGVLFGPGDLLQAMEALHEETGEAVVLAAQNDLQVQYLHLIYSDQPLQFRARPGLLRPLGRSGLGWALLAAKPDEEIEQLRRRINAQPNERLEHAELMEKISNVREKGYSFSKHTMSEGVGMVAMALHATPLGRRFALGVAGYVSRLERKEQAIVVALRAAVSQISAVSTKERP